MVWYPGKNTETGNVFREPSNTGSALARLYNFDRSLYPIKTGYTMQNYTTTDIITKQFKQPPTINQLTKLTEYPTSNVSTGKVSRATLRDKING